MAQAVVPFLRGVYSPGFNATNSGVLPEPGLTYANFFMNDSFDQLRCTKRGSLNANFTADIFADINVFLWVREAKILGANHAFVAGLPFTNSALSLAGLGTAGGGAGFADSFYQPLTLGWHLKRADSIVADAFFAPTGRFTAGASNNTGTGHWTNAPTAGETIYLTKRKAASLSAHLRYELHTTQDGPDIHPGQTFDLDYSRMQIITLQKDMHTLWQFGLVGYGQYEASNSSGPGVNPIAPRPYAVNAIGGAANVILPVRKASMGFQVFREFSNSYTVPGYSLQIMGAITF